MWIIFILIICMIFLVCSTRNEEPEEKTIQVGPSNFVSVASSSHLELDQMTLKHNSSVHPALLSKPPEIKFKGSPNKLYTMIMVDPDYPNPENPMDGEYRHWLVMNIPAGEMIHENSGVQVEDYVPPKPIVGKHRYVFILYEQEYRINQEIEMELRESWSADAFALRWDLKNKGEFIVYSPIL